MNTRPGRTLMALCVAAAVVVTLFSTLFAAVADAAPSITEPSGNPFVVKLDAQGRPVQFTVVAKGLTPGSLVYVEQCNGRPPTAPNWLPTRDCDIGSSPAAAIVDPTGTARFPAGDLNHGFPVFVGLGPEGLFHCVADGVKPKDDGLPVYTTCQIRVSSNNNVTTTDQTFLPIAFEGAHASAATDAKADSGSSAAMILAVTAGAIVVIAILVAFARRRRSASRPA
jgi:hypothetical protein